MSFMLEVHCKSPVAGGRSAAIGEVLHRYGGSLTCREEPDHPSSGPVCLTYEFTDRQVAQQAATCLRSRGEHVEGPVDYGD